MEIQQILVKFYSFILMHENFQNHSLISLDHCAAFFHKQQTNFLTSFIVSCFTRFAYLSEFDLEVIADYESRWIVPLHTRHIDHELTLSP